MLNIPMRISIVVNARDEDCFSDFSDWISDVACIGLLIDLLEKSLFLFSPLLRRFIGGISVVLAAFVITFSALSPFKSRLKIWIVGLCDLIP